MNSGCSDKENKYRFPMFKYRMQLHLVSEAYVFHINLEEKPHHE
jgi:hypothetical protein